MISITVQQTLPVGCAEENRIEYSSSRELPITSMQEFTPDTPCRSLHHNRGSRLYTVYSLFKHGDLVCNAILYYHVSVQRTPRKYWYERH